ncbi:hypothetical protein QE385_003171 [Sphingomonas sp. SORGH_AS 950]|uniref:hypothetical protein n=1 Tax=Sphingomonas sp. SORGH_AS_0950 TaxID=3041792 RepID=UPI002788D2E2|nr:hypothetical protein [Sphingomonas sp. SORGH_AS_0950]MDQ1158844.1 hypothetical protein [Sphingomonas sp. SORGH_AS_0950]
MKCYFQDCVNDHSSKEHVPPKSFFPEDQRVQLLTVPSCDKHNTAKSNDDLYALTHIAMASSPANRSREVWLKRIAPQLEHNNRAFAKTVLKDSGVVDGQRRYIVDRKRMDGFFDAVCCGLIYKLKRHSLPSGYKQNHIYHNFMINHEIDRTVADTIDEFYRDPPLALFEFGTPDLRNTQIYRASIFGEPDAWKNISVVHTFYGVFKVTTLLTIEHAGTLEGWTPYRS